MPTLAELAHDHTELNSDAIEHLTALVSEWGMLADFCFADMLLYVPVSDGKWLITAKVTLLVRAMNPEIQWLF